MKIVQAIKKADKPFVFIGETISLNNPLVLVFGNRYALERPTIYEEIKELFS